MGQKMTIRFSPCILQVLGLQDVREIQRTIPLFGMHELMELTFLGQWDTATSLGHQSPPNLNRVHIPRS